MIVEVEEDEDGNAIIQIPDEFIKKFNLKEGDTVHYDIHDDGKIIIRFGDDKER